MFCLFATVEAGILDVDSVLNAYPGDAEELIFQGGLVRLAEAKVLEEGLQLIKVLFGYVDFARL